MKRKIDRIISGEKNIRRSIYCALTNSTKLHVVFIYYVLYEIQRRKQITNTFAFINERERERKRGFKRKSIVSTGKACSFS